MNNYKDKNIYYEFIIFSYIFLSIFWLITILWNTFNILIINKMLNQTLITMWSLFLYCIFFAIIITLFIAISLYYEEYKENKKFISKLLKELYNIDKENHQNMRSPLSKGGTPKKHPF